MQKYKPGQEINPDDTVLMAHKVKQDNWEEDAENLTCFQTADQNKAARDKMLQDAQDHQVAIKKRRDAEAAAKEARLAKERAGRDLVDLKINIDTKKAELKAQEAEAKLLDKLAKEHAGEEAKALEDRAAAIKEEAGLIEKQAEKTTKKKVAA
jgi:hypothetical protein